MKFTTAAFIALTSSVAAQEFSVVKKIPADKGFTACLDGEEATVVYKGYFTDGKVFDAGMDFKFTIGTHQVIKCWDMALPQMKPSEEATITCPSDLAYGSSGQGVIPGDATLKFDIIVKQCGSQVGITQDPSKVHQHEHIDTKKKPSGQSHKQDTEADTEEDLSFENSIYDSTKVIRSTLDTVGMGFLYDSVFGVLSPYIHFISLWYGYIMGFINTPDTSNYMGGYTAFMWDQLTDFPGLFECSFKGTC